MEYGFNIEHATLYGVNEAIFIKNLAFWISKNKANNKNEFDNRTWTYNSIEAYSQLFPFWTTKQTRNVITSLIKQRVIIKGNYNKRKYDRTSWYAFLEEDKFLNSFDFKFSKPSKRRTMKAEHLELIPWLNEIWREYYYNEKHYDYTPEDNLNNKFINIIEDIEELQINKNVRNGKSDVIPTQENIISGFIHLLEHLELELFVSNNLSLDFIHKRFNNIVAKIPQRKEYKGFSFHWLKSKDLKNKLIIKLNLKIK